MEQGIQKRRDLEEKRLIGHKFGSANNPSLCYPLPSESLVLTLSFSTRATTIKQLFRLTLIHLTVEDNTS